MVAAGDHGHTSCQVADHVMCRLSHPLLIVVKSKVLLDYLFACCQGDLDGSLDNRRQILLKKVANLFQAFEDNYDSTL